MSPPSILFLGSILCLLLLCLLINSSTAEKQDPLPAPTRQKITSLPGFNGTSLPLMYSGYVPVAKDKKIFYWFIPFAGDANENTPVISWQNGGPCSSASFGAFTENGPLRLLRGGSHLRENAFSWNRLGHLLYFDSPASVGYSQYQSTGHHTWNDTEVGHDNAHFLKRFLFEVFPEYSSNPYYMTGESYFGFYSSYFALSIHEEYPEINLKGVWVGNGLIDVNVDYRNKEVNKNYAVYHSLQPAVEGLPYTPGAINPYYLYDNCPANFGVLKKEEESLLHVKSMPSVKDRLQAAQHLMNRGVFAVNEDCVSSNDLHRYMNNPEVKKAFGIPSSVDWEMFQCSYNWSDNVYDIYQKLRHKYRFMFATGDCDTVVNSIGSQLAIHNLGWEVKEHWKQWMVDGVNAGFVMKYDGIEQVTVRGAGHMIATNQPKRGFELIRMFIEDSCC